MCKKAKLGQPPLTGSQQAQENPQHAESFNRFKQRGFPRRYQRGNPRSRSETSGTMNETSGTSDNSASSVNETSGSGRRRRRVAPTSSPRLQSTNQQHGWQCLIKVVFMRHEASDLPSFICHAASDEQAGDGMNFMFLIFQTFLTSVKIITMSTTNSEVPIRMHRGSTDASRSSGSMMQGTEVENKFAGNEVVRIDQTCVSRHQRDTFGISWHIGWKLVVVSFCQNVKSTFCTVW